MRKRFLVFIGSWIVATLLSIRFVDRAASTWSHAVLHGMPEFDALTHLVDPLQAMAVIGLAVSGIAALIWDWRPGKGGLTLIAACLSVVIAVMLKDQLKYAFGRTWPETWIAHNPSWIANGAYGFHFFHGGEGWASFPSGHMTQISSVTAVLWWRIRRLRWVWATLALLVAIGLFGADYHFVGDMVAGAYLGVATAAGILVFVERAEAPNRGVVADR
ncbi:MAG: phosphatase PAP2 family protein [Opitutaceae bacterium]